MQLYINLLMRIYNNKDHVTFNIYCSISIVWCWFILRAIYYSRGPYTNYVGKQGGERFAKCLSYYISLCSKLVCGGGRGVKNSQNLVYAVCVWPLIAGQRLISSLAMARHYWDSTTKLIFYLFFQILANFFESHNYSWEITGFIWCHVMAKITYGQNQLLELKNCIIIYRNLLNIYCHKNLVIKENKLSQKS